MGNACPSFVLPARHSLCDQKDENYAKLVIKIVNFRELGYNIRINVNYLHSNLDIFSEYLCDISEGKGKRLHYSLKN